VSGAQVEMTVSMSPSSGKVKGSANLERLSPLRLWAVTSGNLAYGFMMADQGMLLAPLEAEHLFETQASLGLALMAVCCGVSQLTGPAAGRWSDRHRSRFGRRRPCLVMAMGAVWVLTSFLSVCSEMKLSFAFIGAFLMQQFAWNCMQTVQAGLVPDVIAADQRSAAGGMSAANTLGGAFLALMGVRFLGGVGVQAHYAMTVSVGMMCCVLVCLAANETPTNNIETKANEVYDPLSFLRHIKSCYEFDPARHPQFAKLLLSKTLYCSSVMVKGFLLFFIQDTFKLKDGHKEQAIVGDTAVAAEAVAAFAAVAAMALLDVASAELATGSTTKKRSEDDPQETSPLPGVSDVSPDGEPYVDPNSATSVGAVRARMFTLFGSFWMCVMWIGPLLVGLGVLRDSEAMVRANVAVDRQALSDAWSPYMVLGTAVWGIGQGVYLAGDQALSYALLPDPEEASRLLGLTSICAAAGAVFGGSVTGLLLYTLGGSGKEPSALHPEPLLLGVGPTAPGYAYPGYAGMFLLASALSGASCLVLRTVRTPAELCGERARIAGP